MTRQVFFSKAPSEAVRGKSTELPLGNKNELELNCESKELSATKFCGKNIEDNQMKVHVSNSAQDNTFRVKKVSDAVKSLDDNNDVSGEIIREKQMDTFLTSLDVIDVQHECFGKAWGRLNPKLYISPDSKCIKCVECCKCYHRFSIISIYKLPVIF